jgi:glycosyltransferase involved in cell wall biosynthesis
MRICFVTCGVAASEPRLIKQAEALRHAWPHSEISVCDARVEGFQATEDEIFEWLGLSLHSRIYPTRRTNLAALAAYKVRVAAARAHWLLLKRLSPEVFGLRAVSLLEMLLGQPSPDVYISHGIDTLLPVAIAAGRGGAKIVFDSMEYYSDMGDGQTASEASATRALQSRILSQCALVLTSSDEIADALVRDYKINRPLPLYNTPKVERELPEKNNEFSLYWRNYVIGFGQRGLDDALLALTFLPSDIKLYLQGKLPFDGGTELRTRITGLGLQDRITVKAPHAPGQAVRHAAPHTIGLCLERAGPANHEFTVSNKIFDYMMGGLAVISADLEGLRRVVKRSGGGILFPPGNPQKLAEVIGGLFRDRERTKMLGEKARAFALTEANNDVDMTRFLIGFEKSVLAS